VVSVGHGTHAALKICVTHTLALLYLYLILLTNTIFMFTNVTTAYDLTDATWEIVLMLTVSFLMGWFFRYLWSMRGVDFTENSAPTETVARPERFARYTENDLQIVEGIGPKIEELLKTHGVKNWYDLSAASVPHLRDILQKGGERFQMHEPSSWPDQVSLALENRWSELLEYQTLIPGGRIK
jgi:hypothetical protein